MREKARYRIKLRGHLDQCWESWFGGIEITYSQDKSILLADMPDQSALVGLLNKIHGLGMEIISVDKISRKSPSS